MIQDKNLQQLITGVAKDCRVSMRCPSSDSNSIGVIINDELLTLSTASLVCISLYCMGVIVGQIGTEAEGGPLHYIEFPIPTLAPQLSP